MKQQFLALLVAAAIPVSVSAQIDMTKVEALSSEQVRWLGYTGSDAIRREVAEMNGLTQQIDVAAHGLRSEQRSAQAFRACVDRFSRAHKATLYTQRQQLESAARQAETTTRAEIIRDVARVTLDSANSERSGAAVCTFGAIMWAKGFSSYDERQWQADAATGQYGQYTAVSARIELSCTNNDENKVRECWSQNLRRVMEMLNRKDLTAAAYARLSVLLSPIQGPNQIEMPAFLTQAAFTLGGHYVTSFDYLIVGREFATGTLFPKQ